MAQIDKYGKPIRDLEHQQASKADWEATGMKAVECRDCGENLGYQDARIDIDWDLWEHRRCPMMIAKAWDMTADDVEELTRLMTATINGSYPDFPDANIGNREKDTFRAFRARMAAGHTMEILARQGYRVSHD